MKNHLRIAYFSARKVWGDGLKDPFNMAVLFVLTGIACILWLSYNVWEQYRLSDALTPAEIAQVPAGCAADRIRARVEKGPAVTRGEHNSILKACDDLAARDREQTKNYEDLQRQREALNRPDARSN
jgi:hypothetical protein